MFTPHMMLATVDCARWLALLLDAAAKGAVVLALAGAAGFALRRRSAALRHLVWFLAVLSLPLLPLLSLLVPQWQVSILPNWITPPAPVAPIAQADRPPDVAPAPPLPIQPANPIPDAPPPTPAGFNDVPIVAAPAPRPIAAPAPSPAAPSAPHWPAWALLAWAAGVALFAAPLLAGAISLRRKATLASRLADGNLLAILARLRQTLGIRRQVRLLAGGRGIPLTWGWLRPVIMLPASAADWPADRQRIVLLHELAHIKRLDCLTQSIAHCVRALYWFNPLVWLAVHCLRLARERACDDMVLSAGFKPSQYASQLLDLVKTLSYPRPAALAALAMAKPSHLEGRMLAILDPNRDRRSPRRRAIFAATALAATFALLLSILHATPARPREAAQPRTKPVANVSATAPAGTAVNGLKCVIQPLDTKLAFGQSPRVRVTLENVSDAPIDVIADAGFRAMGPSARYYPCVTLTTGDANGRPMFSSGGGDWNGKDDVKAVRIEPGRGWSFPLYSPATPEDAATTRSGRMPNLSNLLPGTYTVQVTYATREDVEKKILSPALIYSTDSGDLAGKKPPSVWTGVLQSAPVKFEVADDGSEQVAILRAVEAGDGLKNLRLILTAGEFRDKSIPLTISAANVGREPVYIGYTWGLRTVDPEGHESLQFSGPRSSFATEVLPGHDVNLGGWYLTERPGRYIVSAQYRAGTRWRDDTPVLESNALAVDFSNPAHPVTPATQPASPPTRPTSTQAQLLPNVKTIAR